MDLLHTVAELRERLAGQGPVAFVPTMGNLHEGHLALVKKAQELGRCVVVSIFVNRLQFGPNEDFDRYPRTLAGDCEKLAAVGCDVVFAPDETELYPEPQGFVVTPPAIAGELCGAFRPGHFGGVATVVLKLFNLVQPQVAVFGKKDYQQLHIVRSMARQFNLPIEVVGLDTARAADGLALSSRNGYLSPAERDQAVRLPQQLMRIRDAIRAGQRDFAALEAAAQEQLGQAGWRVDYISVRSAASLLPPTPAETALVVLGAAWLGKTRLIDNLEI